MGGEGISCSFQAESDFKSPTFSFSSICSTLMAKQTILVGVGGAELGAIISSSGNFWLLFSRYLPTYGAERCISVLLGHGKKEAFIHCTSPTVGSPLIPPVEPLLKNIKRGRISLQERIKGGSLMVRQ